MPKKTALPNNIIIMIIFIHKMALTQTFNILMTATLTLWPLSSWLQIFVWHWGPRLLETKEPFGATKNHCKKGYTEQNDQGRPQNAMHYLYIVAWQTLMIFEHLVWSFEIVVTSVALTNNPIWGPKLIHIFYVGIFNWRTWLHGALKDKRKQLNVNYPFTSKSSWKSNLIKLIKYLSDPIDRHKLIKNKNK